MSSYCFVLSIFLVFGSDTNAVVESKWQGRKMAAPGFWLEDCKRAPQRTRNCGAAMKRKEVKTAILYSGA